jgi:integrase/recombinase XerD
MPVYIVTWHDKKRYRALEGKPMSKALVIAREGQSLALQPNVSGAESDLQLVGLWLGGRPATTRRAYEREAARFLRHVRKPLRQVSVADVQAFADSLEGAPATRSRAMSAVKSLLTYGQRVGYLTFNVGAALRLPAQKNELAARILPEAATQRMLALEPSARNRLLLRVAYAAGLRVSELCGLTWADVQERDEAGQLTVFGKGGKTRAVLLPDATWRELVATKPAGAKPEDPVFVSRKHGRLNTSAVWRIVKAAAKRAGIEGNVSPHWLRHAHASHSLDRGCPVHVLQATLGHASLATTSRYAHARPSDSSSRYLGV